MALRKIRKELSFIECQNNKGPCCRFKLERLKIFDLMHIFTKFRSCVVKPLDLPLVIDGRAGLFFESFPTILGRVLEKLVILKE